MSLASFFRPRVASDEHGDVVFLGDSITEFWASADRHLFKAGRINKGVSGDTTAQMLARFERDVVGLRPRVVHIMGGTNDLWHGEPGTNGEAAVRNIEGMTTLARANGIAIILAAPPPIGDRARAMFARPAFFGSLCAAIEEHACAAGAIHVDYAYSLARNGVLRPAFTTDGVHLTRTGYRAMRRQAERVLRMALGG